uniref:AB hydrolase-1 domain-containing protein n=1 Tax=Peronospora matthiolae TaxID=2874970 RepID=A0AAV1TPZ9_9STRA
MQLHCVLSILSAGVIGKTLAAPANTSNHEAIKWDHCAGFTFDRGFTNFDAECMIIAAPLCYPGVCEAPASASPTVDVFVKRVVAVGNNAASAPNVIVVSGGPGLSSSTLEWALQDVHEGMGGNVNVYLIERRGTGHSMRLDCTAAQSMTSGSPSGGKVEPSEVPACALDLQNTYGNLAAFSTTSAAMDILDFLATYTNGLSTFVYGRNYGTVVAQRLMQLNPTTVTGYILDSVMTSSLAPDQRSYYPSRDAAFGEVAEHFMELCAQDSECSAHFKDTSLSATLHDVLSKFDSNPNSTCAAMVAEFTMTTPSDGLRKQLGGLLNKPILRSLIPPIVYRLHRCDANDVEVLKMFLQVNTDYTSMPNENEAIASDLLGDLVLFSEFWETPTPSQAELQARFATAGMLETPVYDVLPQYCAFSKEQSLQCAETGVKSYDANGIIYPHDQYSNAVPTISSQASVLLMSGGLDPVTPSKYAKFLFEALDTTKKELVLFDYVPHSVVTSTMYGEDEKDCGLDLLISFVSSNGDLAHLDKSCMAKMPAFDMKVAVESANSYFGTDDAYNGVPAPAQQDAGATPA